MRINPGLRVISLADGSVCIGTGPGALWIAGLDPDDRAFIGSLAACDGRDPDGRPTDARRRELLRLLEPVLVDTPPYRLAGARGATLAPDVAQWSAAYGRHAGPLVERRGRAVVRVYGLDRCGQGIAALLAAAGVGTLMLGDPATVTAADLGAGQLGLADLGTPRPRAVARHLARSSPRTRILEWVPRIGDTREADATVAVSRSWLGPSIAAHLAATQVAHLRVLFSDAGAHVGPLVVPGLTTCLDCAPARELPVAAADGVGAAPTDPETTLAAAAAGIAATQLLMLVDGVNVPAAADGVLSLDLATGGLGRRPVSPRPGCMCLLRAA